jgi:integrase
VDKRRTGSWTKRGTAYYARVRLGAVKRLDVVMAGVHTDEAADARAERIAAVANVLIAARRPHDVRRFAKDIGACATEAHVAPFVRAVEMLVAQAVVPARDAVTFYQFATRWTSGQLHTDHPDHVAKKQSEGDVSILKNHVRDVVGNIPLVAFTVEDADRVMRELGTELSRPYRRAVAQVVHRVLSLAVFPARIIKANPLPKGWLPRIGRPKAKSFLYPREEAALLAGKSDVRIRMLVGFLTREGMRKNEAKALTWGDLDLEVGTVTLDKNKTDAPRSWALGKDVVRALVVWKKRVGGVGPFTSIDVTHLGEWLREELPKVGVTRAQLFQNTEQRMHFRAHDTRSTFVSLSLAEDKSESWVMRRTAHRTSAMIARYAVAAANARELGLGPLVDLDKAIPELRRKGRVPTTNELKRLGGERGRDTQRVQRKK